jgi:hypothetical protein
MIRGLVVDDGENPVEGVWHLETRLAWRLHVRDREAKAVGPRVAGECAEVAGAV